MFASTLRITLAGLVLVGLAACDSDSDSQEGAEAATTSSSVAAAESSTTSATTGDASSSTGACGKEVTSASQFDPAAGVHTALLTAVDEPGRSLSFDMIQWIEDEAEPNGFRIENDNPQVRQAPVGAGAAVSILELVPDVHNVPVDFEALPEHLAGSPKPEEGGALSASPYLLSFADGTISGVCELYTP